ncbi:cytochrome c oxidase subunit II [Tundrisphaera lichenicola]|uniref:cytochrome c oxidase subunit II n=1 Tax=Tundrisphaera lichenicola TaxID=2029860 RepID=UPI003EBFB0EE
MRYWSLVFAAVGLFCVACFAYAPFDPEWWLPSGPDLKVSHLHSVSTFGKEIDSLFVIILWITGAVFVITHVVLVWAAWKYADGPGKIAVYFHGSQRLELALTILPTIALVFITIYQFGTWADVKFRSAAPKSAPLAEVTGRQFQWLIRYAGRDGQLHTGDDVHLINDLHFVKNQMTKIQLRAEDVLHSFFLPELRIKQDAVPGLNIAVWFDADQSGRYELACAELCGWGHYKMRGNVTVHETQSEFDEWLKSAEAEQSRDQVALNTGTEGN